MQRTTALLCLGITLTVFALACGGDEIGGPNGQVAFLGISGVPPSEQFYVGQAVFLSAEAYDREHHLLTGVPITWISSDTATAALAPWGSGVFVNGKGPGSVVITATSQGAKASARLRVIVIPVAAVRVVPASAAAYVSMKAQLGATVLDSSGGVLSGRRVTWTTSDARKATVDATGQVTAVAAGAVTITATCEGRSGTATLAVLARPTADWSRVTDEWVTYQGNPSHSGYVPATLDPVGFASRWETAVVPGTALNPVTVGAGKVFVSTSSYYGTQQLHVLDASSGNDLWSHDFGGISSVDPPAYADGSVYVTTGGHEDSFLWAFDVAAGTLRFRTAYENQWSRWYAPVVIGQTLYMAGGYYGGMYAFNTVDGAQLWFATLNQYDEFTPAVRDGLVYAYTGSYSPKVTVADAATGVVAYEIPDPGFSWEGWSMGLAPVLGASNNLLAAQGGRLLSFDLANHQIGWQRSGGFGGQVTVANGLIYVVNSQTLEARQESDGALLWAWAPPEGYPQGTMIATENLLFVGTGATTYALDLAAHLQAWSYPAGGHLALSQDGLLLIAQSNGKLTAIAMK